MALKTTAYLAIDAGGTYLKSAVLDRDGNVVDGSSFSTRSFSDGGREEILNAYLKTFTHGLTVIGECDMRLGGIGISTPGPFDYEKATPLMQHKFKSVYGFDLRSAFYQMPGIDRDVPVRFMQDANAILTGEIHYGNARGFANAALVTLGTGLGFAVSESGKVLSNPLGGPFYIIFSIPYNGGILEDFTASRGIIRIYKGLLSSVSTDGLAASDIGYWADRGDVTSVRTFQKVGRILGEALRDILLERKTECLLFGGQISRSFHHMEQSLRETLCDVSSLRKITRIKNMDNAALMGVHAVLLQN